MRHGQPRCVCSADCSATALRAGAGSNHGNSANFNRISGSLRNGGNGGTSTLGGPVCAFDGRTYRNQCALSRFNCRFSKEIHAEYNGRCQSELCSIREFRKVVVNSLETFQKINTESHASVYSNKATELNLQLTLIFFLYLSPHVPGLELHVNGLDGMNILDADLLLHLIPL